MVPQFVFFSPIDYEWQGKHIVQTNSPIEIRAVMTPHHSAGIPDTFYDDYENHASLVHFNCVGLPSPTIVEKQTTSNESIAIEKRA